MSSDKLYPKLDEIFNADGGELIYLLFERIRGQKLEDSLINIDDSLKEAFKKCFVSYDKRRVLCEMEDVLSKTVMKYFKEHNVSNDVIDNLDLFINENKISMSLGNDISSSDI